MLKKIMATALVLSVLGIFSLAPDALAKRRCPRGQDDNGTNICVPKAPK